MASSRLAFVLGVLVAFMGPARTRLATKSPQTPNPPAGSAHWQAPLINAVPTAYLMEISLGTPAQSFLAIANTASDLSWLPCPPCQLCNFYIKDSCTDCGVGYFANYSTTYVPLPCSSSFCHLIDQNGSGSICSAFSSDITSKGCYYVYRFGDRSQTSGNIGQDTITMQAVKGGNQTVANFWFGCSTEVKTDLEGLGVDLGLVGLGRGQISLPSQLGSYFGNKFGYCLVNRSISTSKTDVYSTPLYFGPEAVPVTTADGPQLQYTPMIVNSFYPSLYYVGLDMITMNGEKMPYLRENAFDIASDGNGGIFFDSGAEFTALRTDIYNILIDGIDRNITKYNVSDAPSNTQLCYEATWDEWVGDYGQAVPVISFHFSNTSGFTLSVDTAWYYDTVFDVVCLAMGSSATFNRSTFGNRQQVGYQIVFDLENSQIGFVPAECPATQFQGLPPNVPSPGTSLLITGVLPLLSSLLTFLVVLTS